MQNDAFHILKKLMHNNGYCLRKSLDCLGLYPGQPKMIHILSKHDGMTKKDLAEKLSVAAPTITKMVERLENKGFIYSQKDEHDKRITKVYLDAKGHEILEALKASTNGLIEIYFKDFSDEEVALFLNLAQRVNANIEATKRLDDNAKCCHHK